ncbi:IS1 family transposase [Serratia quinivorans]|uniref:IS1 family transposase n=1 Tax=Serratia quinivorans TaxID=137545 RepID=UPI0039B102A6
MLLLDTLQIQLICEVDEMQSVTGYKERQCWLWHAWARQKRTVVHVLVLEVRKCFAIN